MGTMFATRMDLGHRNCAAGRAPDTWDLPDKGRNLQVLVLFTDVPSTLEALRYASDLPHAERAPIHLLVPRVVPYPLPLHEPDVQTALLAKRFRLIAAEAKVETQVDILLCRDSWEAIQRTLATPRIVVIGGHRRWWPTREQRIAKRLRAEGHYVVFAESK